MFASYMLSVWLVGTLIALAAGCAGFFVVLRRASFAAHALPMAAFPGAAAGKLLGVGAFYGLVPFALAGAAGLSWLRRRQRADTATALLLVALLGLGALLLSLSGRYAGAVYALLFGQILAVGPADLPVALLIGLAVPLALLLLFRPLTLGGVAPELVAVHGCVGPALAEGLFLVILALAAALALPLTGALLVFSLMVGPGAAACLLAARPGMACLLSAGLAVLLVWLSLALAWLSGWPMGLFVGCGAALTYGLARLIRRS